MDDRFFVKKQKLALPMGRQFEALDQTNKVTVLVHRFAKGDSDKKDIWRETFHAHAVKLKRLQDPSLPAVIDYGVDDQGPFLVMDEPQGLRLSDVVNCGPMMAASVRQMAYQFLHAYVDAAKEGLYHSALNPMLILVGENAGEGNRFLLPDIGFAEIHNAIQGEEGRVLGDPVFLSPSQLSGEHQDEAGSLFSLGQLCYYCLAGGHPFGGMALPAILQGYEDGQLPSIDQFRNDMPADFVQWLNRMTAVGGGQAFQTASEALAALPEVGGLQAIPMDLTGVVSVQPASSTSAQTVAPHNRPKLLTGSQIRPATAATSTQPVMSAQAPAAAVSPQLGVAGVGVAQPASGIGALLDTTKKKIIASSVGGGILLLIIIGLVAASGDDKPKKSDGSSDEEAVVEKATKAEEMDQETRELFRGLAYGWNFDQDLLPINRNSPAIEPYNNLDYSEGVDRKALVLGPENYYSIPKESGLFIENYSASTVNLWIKAPSQWERGPMIIGNKKYNLPGSRGWCIAAVPVNEEAMKFRLNTYDGKETRIADSQMLVSAGNWHMFTIVFENGAKTKFYQDGNFAGEVDIPNTRELYTGKDLFIGTDEVFRAIFNVPVQIDQLYLWHRGLSKKEVQKLFRDKSRYIP
ncbi:Serine/threonine protein kinase [Rubritalea squalenifaciens DSM 18772]|uniref:Serine/threonine protein kinase n=2 Tax=Rubritalea squalenifaciens TaxID=407226 RepID=A0A1M6EQ02_9BACT|nr:Serine/threonine protein kinase [Rubritalea squalenifaciens DSM 18772]